MKAIRGNTKALEREIDQLVYEIYGSDAGGNPDGGNSAK